MFGKRASQYIVWADHAEYLRTMPFNCQVVNTGSTPSYKAFDYNQWKITGFNLGFQPQPLYYDFETLKKYSEHILEGAIILIGIEEFKFFVDGYCDETTDHKYYLWLDGEQIRTYRKSKEWCIKHAPILLHPRFLFSEIKRDIKKFQKKNSTEIISSKIKPEDKEKIDQKWAELYDRNWKREFGWEFDLTVTEEQKKNIVINEKRLSDMIDYCLGKGWKPYIVVLPFSPNLTRLLSNKILKTGLWEPLERIRKEKQIQILNFYFDEKFADYGLYADALTFNINGKKMFNKIIQERLGIDMKSITTDKQKIYKLRNGLEIPWISYGTGVIWKYSRNKTLFIKTNIKECLRSIKHRKISRELYGNVHIKKALRNAYEMGFRMFDTGRIYGKSEKAIKKSIGNLSDIFISSKCSAMDVERHDSPDTVKGNLEITLKNLGKDKLDLYLLHWPEGNNWLDYYRQIIETYKEGRIKSYGACNLKMEHLKAIQDAGLDLPMVIQEECHPFYTRADIRKFCRENNIIFEAHTPTMHMNPKTRNNELLIRMAQKYGKTIPQIIIRWHYQNNVIPVCSTFNKIHMKENLEIFDFELTNEEIELIEGLNENCICLNSSGIDDPNYIYND